MPETDAATVKVTEVRPKAADPRNAGRKRSRRSKPGKRRLRTKPADLSPVLPKPTTVRNFVSNAALVVAVALGSVSGFFGISGMTAIFAATALAVIAMTGALEVAKLVTAAWLARHWRVAPLLLRLPLVVMVLLLMALTAVGTFGFLSRAHLEHQITAVQAIDREAAPLAQRISLAESKVQDLDGRILRLDEMVKVATARGRTQVAMTLVGDQSHSRSDLVAQRQAAAERLSDLRVAQAGIEAQRARVASEVGPALYLAKLFGSDDTEGAVRLITALLVLILDPLAVLLTIAASTEPPAPLSPQSPKPWRTVCLRTCWLNSAARSTT